MPVNERESSWTHRIFEESPFSVQGRQPQLLKIFDISASLSRAIVGMSEKKGLTKVEDFDQTITEQGDVGVAIRTSLLLPNTSQQKAVNPMVPITPQIARVTGFTRKDGKGWSPGMYIRNLIIRGSRDLQGAQEIWKTLADTLKTDIKDNSGVWSETITSFFGGDNGEVDPITEKDQLSSPSDLFLSRPAKTFVKYLPDVLKLEPILTRYQWITVFDSYLRLTLAADLLWVASLNKHLFDILEAFFRDAEEWEDAKLDNLLKKRIEFTPIKMGTNSSVVLKQYTRHYIRGRLRLNLMLRLLYGDKDPSPDVNLNSIDGIKRLLVDANTFGKEKLSAQIRGQTVKIHNDEPKLMKCDKTGVFSEGFYTAIFYCLRRHKTKDPLESYFDQGYWARKIGEYTNATYEFWPGPVPLVLFTHLASQTGNGISTAGGFKQLLSQFGIDISTKEINSGKVGLDMRNLGLIVDSPDAEGGMLIKGPFGGTHE